MSQIPVKRPFGRYRLPVIVQAEAAECGLASLAMIVNYHGQSTTLAAMRVDNEFSLQGCTMRDIVDIAAKYQLEARGVKVEAEDIAELDMPAILHWDMNHFVVLKSVDKKGVVIHDPAIGEKQLTHAELSQHFTGVALELSPSREFKESKQQSTLSLASFFTNMPGLKEILIQLFALSVILQLCAIVSPFYFQWITDEVLVTRDTALLKVIAIGFTLLLLFQLFITYLRTHISIYLSSRLSLKLGTNVFDHLLKLPMSYFEKRHMGDVVSRFRSIDSLQEFVSDKLVSITLNLFISVAMLAMIFIYSPSLAWVVVISASLYAALRVVSFISFKRTNSEIIVSRAKENSNFMETVRSMQAIKLYSKEQDRKSLWVNRMSEVVNLDIQLDRLQLVYNLANKLLFGLENIIVLYLGAQFIMEGDMTIGVLLAFISYKGQFTSSVDGLISDTISYKLLSIHLVV